MSTRDYLPKNDRNFLQWVITFLLNLLPWLTRFSIPHDRYQTLDDLRNDFSAKFDVAENPATRTKKAVKEKTDARKTLEKAVRQFVQQFLTHNPDVTDGDREDLGLPIYKPGRTPSPIATDAPDAEVDTSHIGRLNVHFFEKGHKHKKGKPAGQHGAEIAWIQRDTPPTRWDELLHSNIDTNSPFTLVFENDLRGKTVYFALRWENTRGEKGPWSEIMNAIIP
jgi:hypothetical protein